jgi:hypothetical protein
MENLKLLTAKDAKKSREDRKEDRKAEIAKKDCEGCARVPIP